jgi:hypothetical protein
MQNHRSKQKEMTILQIQAEKGHPPRDPVASSLFWDHSEWLSYSDVMELLHVLDHVPLAHPPLGADTIASRIGALEWRWMLFLEMNFQELFGLEGAESNLVATFKGARISSGIIIVWILCIDVDVMVVPNMLTKVVFTFEAIGSSISIGFD